MRLGKYLSSLTKPELEELKELLNLSDDELKVFENLSKNRSKATIADKCLVSVSTVDNRIKSINAKLFLPGLNLSILQQGMNSSAILSSN